MNSYKPRYWNFNMNDLFSKVNEYEDRLNCIKVREKQITKYLIKLRN